MWRANARGRTGGRAAARGRTDGSRLARPRRVGARRGAARAGPRLRGALVRRQLWRTVRCARAWPPDGPLVAGWHVRCGGPEVWARAARARSSSAAGGTLPRAALRGGARTRAPRARSGGKGGLHSGCARGTLRGRGPAFLRRPLSGVRASAGCRGKPPMARATSRCAKKNDASIPLHTLQAAGGPRPFVFVLTRASLGRRAPSRRIRGPAGFLWLGGSLRVLSPPHVQHALTKTYGNVAVQKNRESWRDPQQEDFAPEPACIIMAPR